MQDLEELYQEPEFEENSDFDLDEALAEWDIE